MGGADRRLADGANNRRHGLVFVSIGGLDAPKQSADERIQLAGTPRRRADFARNASGDYSHRHVYAIARGAAGGRRKTEGLLRRALSARRAEGLRRMAGAKAV